MIKVHLLCPSLRVECQLSYKEAALSLRHYPFKSPAIFYKGSFQDIGIIITGLIFMAVITSFFVIKSTKLMDAIEG
ncbi:MAG: hypothetical protein K0R66_1348 [Gammaproteobacteria bacterium]|jgi:hypothetical protein|nr:hypothetical protein [Gammaproteobacteria bacterium]